MEYKKFDIKRYEPFLGEYYQIPKITQEEERKLISELEFRAMFQEFSNEFNGSATPKGFF